MTSSKPNSDPHRRKASPDTLLDSLLSEMLAETAVPNFAPRHEELVASARDGCRQHGLFTPEELQTAADRAWRESQFDIAASAQGKSLRAPVGQTSVIKEHRYGWDSKSLLLLATAASLIGVLLTVVILQRLGNSDRIAKTDRAFPKLGSGNDDLFPPQAKTNEAVASNGTTIVSEAPNGSVEPASIPGTEPDLSTKVAMQENSGKSSSNPSNSETSAEAQAKEPLPQATASMALNQSTLGRSEDLDTIAVINDQLRHLWKRVGVNRGKHVDLSRLEDRLAQLLVGRLPTSTEREWARKAGLGVFESAQLLAERWINSDEFDRHWAGILSDYYLDQNAEVNPTEPQQRFTNWLQDSLRANRSIASIEHSLFTADSSASQLPESYWWTHWSTVGATNDLRRTGDQIWTPVVASEEARASLESVSRQVLRLSGHSGASCAQCHMDNRPSLDPSSGGTPSDAFEHIFLGTSALVSFLQDPRKTEFYAADPEGKISLIGARLPDGSALEDSAQSRQAFGDWVAKSERARESLIDYVWYRIVGQPLMPSVGLDEEEGMDERRDLLGFLAHQTQSTDANLRNLVYWIALSDPVALESSDLDAAEFLKLDLKTLADHQRVKRLFASYSGSTRPSRTSNRLGNLVQWLAPNANTTVSNGLLAQPSSGVGAIESLTLKQESMALIPSNWTPERVAFEASDAVPYNRVRDFANAFASSPLDWDSVVDHSFLTCLSRYPTGEERKQAANLLEWSNRDRQQASTRLINALLGQL